VAAGYLLHRAANQALWEGVLALVAAASVASLTIHMWRSARRIKRDIEGHLQSSTLRDGAGAFFGVFGFTLLMGTLLFQVQAVNIIAGAVLGIILSACVAALWSRYGYRVNLALFFQVTAVFLLVFVVQLLVVGVHELSEAFMRIPFAEWLHWKTEPYGPDGIYGQYLTYMLVLLPVCWLAGSAFRARRDLPQSGRFQTAVRN